MPNKLEKTIKKELKVEDQAHSFDRAQIGHKIDSSFVKENTMINSHRAPVIIDQRAPLLTDRFNTNLKNFETSQMSMNYNSTFRQDQEGEDNPNCYLILPWDDIKLVVDSINEDNEQMKIYFGCKALKSILLVASTELTR